MDNIGPNTQYQLPNTTFMDLQLKHKKALVTGSTLGIGYAIAQSLLREGASVYINGRNEQRVNEAMAKLKAEIPGRT